MRPSLGVLVGLPVVGILVLASLAAVAFGVSMRRYPRRDTFWGADDDRFLGAWLLGSGVVALVLTVSISAFAFWPYQKQYHWWQPVHGQVEQVSSRLLPAGERTVTQKFVVKLRNDPHPYGIDDTRASLLKPGDSVSLSCIRVYTYASGDNGYDCKWGR